MNREATFTYLGAAAPDSPERGERVRFTEALGIFEEMHQALKSRVFDTPEHRAMEGLDAVLALVATGARRASRHLDLDGFSAFRGSIELLHDNTPEARALDLFEGALRSMIASASDFDDLPDAGDAEGETAEAAGEADETGGVENEADPEADPTGEDRNDGQESFDAQSPAAESHGVLAAAPHEPANNEADMDAMDRDGTPAAANEPERLEPMAGEYESAFADQMAADSDREPAHDGTTIAAPAEDDSETDTPTADDGDEADIKRRIGELETELAAARAHVAA